MTESVLPGREPRAPDELAEVLRAEFPNLHVDWSRGKGGACFVISSRVGSHLHLEIVYPVDVECARDAIRNMLRDDALRDRVTDVLVSEMGGYEDLSLGNAPYVLRWLVLAQHALVTFGDDATVEPVLRSSSVAVISAPARQLKVWRDGAAVLHVDDASIGREESRGLDLTRISLKDFQALWLRPLEDSSSATDPQQLLSFTQSPSEASAVELLIAYADAAWLRHPAFAGAVLRHRDGVSIDWHAANRLSTVDTEATVQDRAVLAVACHLSGQVDPDVTLADALHFVGDAKQLVLEAIATITGTHPDPDGSWPTDCSPTCP